MKENNQNTQSIPQQSDRSQRDVFHFSISKQTIKYVVVGLLVVVVIGLGTYQLGKTVPIRQGALSPTQTNQECSVDADCPISHCTDSIPGNCWHYKCLKGTCETSVDRDKEANDYIRSISKQCGQDSDCVPVGCNCTCSGGGGFSYEEVVNKMHEDWWYTSHKCEKPTICNDEGCPQMKLRCENNECTVKYLTPSPQPVVTQQLPTPSQQDIYNLVNAHKTQIIADLEDGNGDFEIVKAELLSDASDDVYIVSIAWIDAQGNRIARGGSWVLVGLVGDRWTVAYGTDANYCRWLKESSEDEATKLFMGIGQCQN